MLLVANLANTKRRKKSAEMTETLAYGPHLRVLSESFPMNTNMTGFGRFSKNLCVLALGTKVASALEGISNYTMITS